MTSLLWQPTADQVAQSNLSAFMRFVAERGHPATSEYAALHRWSIDEPEAFWAAVWDFCGVVASRRYETVVERFDRMPGARWFPGARLNFAQNLLRFRDGREALVHVSPEGRRSAMTYEQLGRVVERAAQALSQLGV